jgi:serine/threonine protein kinase
VSRYSKIIDGRERSGAVDSHFMSSDPPDDERTIMPTRTATGMPPPIPSAIALGSNTLPIGTQLGEFEVTGLVGEGGFGIVYLAYDHSLQRRVAVKEYMPSALAARTGAATVAVKSARHAETFQAGLRSFINEARLLAQFDHPSLVKVYRFWEANGTAYMVMPFYEGTTLKEVLKKLGAPPDENWLKDLLRPLLDALAIIHREQCYHRDIAPDNILILKDGRPLLLDFGAARRVIGDMTHALTVILKPGYAPVEQYAEVPSMKQGAWTDIYALGSVVYYAIVGRAPVPSVARLMSDPLEPLSKTAAGRYSEEFLGAIDQALAVKPEDRPQQAVQLRDMLGLGDRRVRSRAVTLEPAPPPPAEPVQKPTAAVTQPLAPQPPASAQPQRVPLEAPTVAAQPRMSAKPQAAPAAPLKRESAKVQSPAKSAPRSAEKSPLALYTIGAVGLLALAAGGVWFLMGDDKAQSKLPAPPATGTASVTPRPAEPSTKPAPAVEPSAPLPAATPQVEKKPFSPLQMLDDVFAGRSRPHAVAAAAEKAQVRVGRDHLRFSVSSSKAGYVYVLEVGTNRSDFHLLFPNTADNNNRITPGKTLKLPGPQWAMTAQGPPGTDQFIAIVSDEPRDFKGLGAQADDVFTKFPLDVGAQLYAGYSGATPLYAGKAVCSAAADCSQSYGAALFSIEEIAAPADERGSVQPPPGLGEMPPKTAPPLAAAPKESAPRAANSSPKMEARSTRCSDILQRASLGEPLTQEEQTLLKRDCR